MSYGGGERYSRAATLKAEHAPHEAILFDTFHKYTRMSHRENLTTDGGRQLWDYERAGWARCPQGAKPDNPTRPFVEMISRHRGGIVAYCQPENAVTVGYVEGVNNTIRVIQRWSYG